MTHIKLAGTVLLIMASVTLHAQSFASNYIIKQTRDTVVVERIKYYFGLKSDLTFTVTLPGGKKQAYAGSEIWRFKETRKNKPTIYQVAFIEGKKGTVHRVMEVNITGRLTLLYEDAANLRWPFVTGDGFNGYVTGGRAFKEFLAFLDKCPAFKKAWTERKVRKPKYLTGMVRYYNDHCHAQSQMKRLK